MKPLWTCSDISLTEIPTKNNWVYLKRTTGIGNEVGPIAPVPLDFIPDTIKSCPSH